MHERKSRRQFTRKWSITRCFSERCKSWWVIIRSRRTMILSSQLSSLILKSWNHWKKKLNWQTSRKFRRNRKCLITLRILRINKSKRDMPSKFWSWTSKSKTGSTKFKASKKLRQTESWILTNSVVPNQETENLFPKCGWFNIQAEWRWSSMTTSSKQSRRADCKWRKLLLRTSWPNLI